MVEMSKSSEPAEPAEPATSAAAALFDLRTVIAVLFGVYGIILTIMGIVGSDAAAMQKSAGINLNLWTGIGMLVIAIVFVVWQRMRPQLGAPE